MYSGYMRALCLSPVLCGAACHLRRPGVDTVEGVGNAVLIVSSAGYRRGDIVVSVGYNQCLG